MHRRAWAAPRLVPLLAEAHALDFSRAGKDGLEGTRADVEADGGEALAVPTDVAHSDEVEAAAEDFSSRSTSDPSTFGSTMQ